MPRFYSWKSASGRTGRSTEGGIVKLLRGGTRFVQIGVPVARRVSIAERVVRVARGELGVREVPRDSNRGPRVQVYQAATNVGGTGWAWCCAFALWVWDQAGVKHDGYRGGYVPHLELWARKAGRWRTGRPKAGWLVVFGWGSSGVADHVGVVEQAAPFVTIEGNAQPGPGGNQSNGGGVYERRDRTPAVIRGYVAA